MPARASSLPCDGETTAMSHEMVRVLTICPYALGQNTNNNLPPGSLLFIRGKQELN
jgi:hypothetical protein